MRSNRFLGVLLISLTACSDGTGDVAPQCTHANDCSTAAGCADGCTCSGGVCRSGVSCTPETEVLTCGPGAICNRGACLAVPSCITQADCDKYGLYCNLEFNLCGRGFTCAEHGDCTAPKGFCNPISQRCEAPDCNNGGVSCSAPKSECAPSGECVEPAVDPPGSCTKDTDCCPERKMDCQPGQVERCLIPSGGTTGTCELGCATNERCEAAGQDSCNSKGQCIKGGKQFDPCGDEKTDCRAGYYCCPILHQCFERCTEDGECPDTGVECVTVFINELCVGY